jgi:hypothetical protein
MVKAKFIKFGPPGAVASSHSRNFHGTWRCDFFRGRAISTMPAWSHFPSRQVQSLGSKMLGLVAFS